MNEKPGLEPGFFCSTSCWRLDGLRVAPGAEDMLVLPLRGWFSNATWAAAETIDVKYYGKLDLAPFACTEVTRSSFINRACYDKANQFMVVQLKTVYYPYCEVPAA